jgi:NADH pyrophosphatase NudC (nudix superfamily)
MKSPDIVFQILIKNRLKEVLLVRSRQPQAEYRYPSGTVQPGEILPQAVRRVAFEQVGLALTRIGPKQFFRVLVDQDELVGVQVMAQAATANRPLVPSAELADAGWFSADDVRRNPLVDQQLKDDLAATPRSRRFSTRRYTAD